MAHLEKRTFYATGGRAITMGNEYAQRNCY